MRARSLLLVAPALALPGCGGEGDHVNGSRPASAINVSAVILDERISISPRRFGAGPVRLLVSNQTGARHEVTFETTDGEGVTRTTGPIAPGATASLELDVPRGGHVLRAGKRRIAPASVTVGAARPSAQDQLLIP